MSTAEERRKAYMAKLEVEKSVVIARLVAVNIEENAIELKNVLKQNVISRSEVELVRERMITLVDQIDDRLLDKITQNKKKDEDKVHCGVVPQEG